MHFTEAFHAINEAPFLFLRDLREPNENALSIVIEEARANHDAVAFADPALPRDVRTLLAGAHPVEPMAGCRRFALQWENYVAYLVANESYALADDAAHEGRLLRTYKESRFLDHLARGTWNPEPLLHCQLICENHVIDVASFMAPSVRVIAMRE